MLFSQIKSIEENLAEKFSSNGFANHIASGTRYNGNGKVEAYLSYEPDKDSEKESIDLNLSLSCTEKGALFSTKILWSSGRVIDEVIVCEVCPECPDDVEAKVERLMEKNHTPLLDRMTELYDNFES